MKVLHVQRSSGIGGSENHLLSLLPGLEAAGTEVQVCILGTGQWSRFTSALSEQAIPWSVTAAPRDLSLGLARGVYKHITRFRPDVVHTHLAHADLYGQLAARAAGLPSVSSVHSVHWFYEKPLHRPVLRLSARLATQRIAVSQFVAGFLQENRLAGPGSPAVIPYGIDVSRWKQPVSVREEARTTFGIPAGGLGIGIASRLIEGKGHRLLINAIAEATSADPSLRLMVAGDGPLRDRLETYASKNLPLGTYLFLGHLDDMSRFLSACDVVVFPTSARLQEGFGLAGLEAMAAGRPLIATAVGSLPELVEHETTGFILPPGDAGALIGAILSLAADRSLRIRLGIEGRRRAEKLFSLDRMVAGTLNVYKDVLRG